MFNFMRLPPLRRLMLMKAITGGGSWSTVTGNPVSFTAKAAPLRQLEVAFSPVQDLHGYDSPWPAGGGKNLLKYATAIVSNTTARFRSILLKGGTTYTISYYGATNVRIIIYDNASGTTIATSSYTKVYQFSPADDTAVDIAFYNSDGITSAENLFQAEAGTQSTSFAPYENICPISGWDSLNVYHSGADTSNPQTISITLGQTVYSGVLDLVTGVVTVDWVGIDGGSLTWKKINGNAYRTFAATPSPTPQKGNAPSTAINVICDNYISKSFASASATNDNYIWVSAESTDQLCIKDTSRAGMSVAEFTQYMTGMTIVYRLATPIPIQLTPQEVQSLLGENVMWSDANGDLTVEYRSN